MGLTKLGADAKMKKNKEILVLDQEGNIKKILVRSKITKPKNIYDFRNFSIGFYILTPIILGVFLGLAIDNWLKTQPIFFIFFLVLGTLSSFYNIFRLSKNE